MIGFFQFETIRGIFRHIIASRKTVPPRIFRIVPFGDFHICFSLNSKNTIETTTMHTLLAHRHKKLAHLCGSLTQCALSLDGQAWVQSPGKPNKLLQDYCLKKKITYTIHYALQNRFPNNDLMYVTLHQK